MRRELRRRSGERTAFTGEFVRYGSKPGYRGPPQKTILLRNIRDLKGQLVTEHLWFNLTKGFAALGLLAEGDRVQFDARIKPYEKGYKGRREDVYLPVSTDYKLSHPTQIQKLART